MIASEKRYRCKKCGAEFSQEIYDLFSAVKKTSPCGGDIEVIKCL